MIIIPPVPSSSTHQSVNSIFILAGQSNMAGRGGVTADRWDRLVPPESHPNPSVLRLSARLTWAEAREPLHADIDVNKTCGVGPGLPFANAARALDSTLGKMGLVPCAVGGTTIAEWARGGRLYDRMVKRAEAAVRESDGGVVRAVLWYQGESDTLSQADAESYRGNLEKLFSDFRNDLNSPALPIIQACLVYNCFSCFLCGYCFGDGALGGDSERGADGGEGTDGVDRGCDGLASRGGWPASNDGRSGAAREDVGPGLCEDYAAEPEPSSSIQQRSS
ncbi:hypothetical protein Sjap_017365 [Stephania japonica]|uniref:Sialate O-acetylesterase domain-containing protein n=1 Tax=Stephania japonica TaxID=461633 RepID=A0AAP0I647_9MAGN